MRVRTFTQDDAHIFMRRDQIKDEVLEVISLIDKFYKVFGKEMNEGKIAVRSRKEGDLGTMMLEDFVNGISAEREQK